MLPCPDHSHNPDCYDLQVPQTPASLAQMSLAQRAEQALLQERVLESQNEAHGVIEPHTVTIVGSGAGGTALGASGGAFQVRGLGQMAAGATLQLAQLAGGQVGYMMFALLSCTLHLITCSGGSYPAACWGGEG